MKKTIILLLVLVLAAVTAGCAGSAQAENENAVAAAMPARLEGDGYATPEDALAAYVDAMNRGDVGGMLSTFAMETFSEHAIPYLFLAQNGYVTPGTLQKWLPTDDAFLRSLTVQTRYGLIASELMCSLAYIGIGSAMLDLKTEEQQQAFQNRLGQSVLYNIQGKTEFVRWLTPVQLATYAVQLADGRDVSTSHLYTGMDDITEVVAELSINGQTAIQVMTCVRYGDRWYNLEPGGKTIMLSAINASSYNNALWILTEEEKKIYQQLLTEDRTEENAAWNALQTSELAGQRWPLVSLSTPGITVADSREDVEEDDMGVWAEVSFHRTGGAVITFAAGASLRETLKMTFPTAHIGFAWSPDGVQATYINSRGKTIRLFRAYHKEEIGVEIPVSNAALEGDTLTLVLDDRTQVVFQKPENPTEIKAAEVPTGEMIGKLEGNGFDTPQEAVLAYVDAMNRADARAMLSTIAMESYVSYADPLIYLDQLRAFDSRFYDHIPYLDADMVRSLAAYARYGNIAQNLLRNCASFTMDVTLPIKIGSLQDIAEFQDQFRQSPLWGLEGNVEFLEWISPACLTEGKIKDIQFAASQAVSEAMNHPDDLTCLVALIRINGTEIYQVMECVRYGDRWYNLRPGGYAAYMLNKTPVNSYLWMPTETEKADYAKRLAGYQAEDVIWNRLQESDLAGSHWALVSFTADSGDQIRVYDDPSAASADTKMGVQGKMQFFRMGGGIISFTVSPALQSALETEKSQWLVAFGWQPAAEGKDAGFGAFREVVFRGKENPVDQCCLSPDGKEITVTLFNGMQAVFRKP